MCITKLFLLSLTITCGLFANLLGFFPCKEKKDAALAKHEQKQNKKAELAEKKPKAKAKAKSKGKAEPKAEPKARGRPKKTVSPKKASPKKAPARKRKAVSPVPDGKKKNKMSDATPEPKSWKPSPMAKTGKQISSKNDERMSKAMEALEELKEKNADMPHFNIPDAGFSRKILDFHGTVFGI